MQVSSKSIQVYESVLILLLELANGTVHHIGANGRACTEHDGLTELMCSVVHKAVLFGPLRLRILFFKHVTVCDKTVELS